MSAEDDGKVYVIVEESGAYSDRMTVPVLVCESKEEADAIVDAFNDERKRFEKWKCQVCGRRYYYHEDTDACAKPEACEELRKYAVSESDWSYLAFSEVEVRRAKKEQNDT